MAGSEPLAYLRWRDAEGLVCDMAGGAAAAIGAETLKERASGVDTPVGVERRNGACGIGEGLEIPDGGRRRRVGVRTEWDDGAGGGAKYRKDRCGCG